VDDAVTRHLQLSAWTMAPDEAVRARPRRLTAARVAETALTSTQIKSAVTQARVAADRDPPRG
jgi:hypothetical protein